MFFIISKLIEAFLLPSNLVGLIALVGIALLALRWTRTASTVLSISAVLLVVVGWLPVGSAALQPLENRFPRPDLPQSVAGIVVLGGEIDTHISSERKTVAINDAGERLTTAAALARRYPDARIILSGGLAHILSGHAETESAYAKQVLVDIGVPAARIELEEHSRNTCENAFDSKTVADPKAGQTWLLVTSAYHMPRAVACFRAADFPVLPYPVDYRSYASELRQPAKSIAVGLTAADLAAHEWIGLAAYHFFKHTEFFPAPD